MLFPVTFALDPYAMFIDHFGSGFSHNATLRAQHSSEFFHFPSAMDRMLRLMEDASHVRIGKGESE